jgi:UDP-N-acetylglucosamine 4,6-dehydratase/5-epimerase
MFDKKTILVTGGTGSFGKKFIKSIFANHRPKKVIVYSRDELKQFEMQKQFPEDGTNPIRYFIGDVRDSNRLNMALQDVDYVVHTAALKQVPAIEYNPFEAVKTNIIGAQNIIEACLINNVKKIIALSTDKAAAPINLYGATKLASDKLFISANAYAGKNDISISVVRYGNVLGSRGSVIPFFLEKKEQPSIPITDERMTRFSITLQQGVDFVMKCFKNMVGGEIFVPKIPSYRIMDLKNAIAPNASADIVGIRPGEKLHEEMITVSDSLNTIDCSDYYVILPSTLFLTKSIYEKHNNIIAKKCDDGFSYNSENNNVFLSVDEIKKMVKENLE